MMPLISLMLTHLVKQRNNAQDSESQHPDNAQYNCPCLPVIETLNKKHEAQNGNQYGRNKEWNLHIEGNFLKVLIKYAAQK
jgi:hypothetical protein